MEKYNIMTVLNSDYFDFGKMFVNSFYDVMNLKRLNKLYIFDTGLSKRNKAYLSGFPKLEIVSTNLVTRHNNLHDEDWCKNVYSKTLYLQKIINKDQLPTIMIDSDCMFVKDFIDILPENKDFIVCKRDVENNFCEYIASFFAVINPSAATNFIKEWREEMYYGTENHKESPALSRLIYKEIYEVSELKEDLISCTKAYISKDTYIIHMKSTSMLRTVEQRVKQSHLINYCNKYLLEVPMIGKEDYVKQVEQTTKKQNNVLQNLTLDQKIKLLQKIKK